MSDAEGATDLYQSPTLFDDNYLGWREAVVACRPPGPLVVMDNTFVEGDEVRLQSYAATLAGLVQSWYGRHV